MIKAQIGDMKIEYSTHEELRSKLEAKLKENEERLKKLEIEPKRLKKQNRAIKKVLAGLSNEKVPQVQSSVA